MTTHTRNHLVAVFLALSVSLIACKKQEAPPPEPTAAPPPPPTAVPTPAVTVTDLSLGKSLGPDKKVQTPTDTFKPKDTIFAVVSTDGSAASSVIAVKWTFGEGQTVKEDSMPNDPDKPDFSDVVSGSSSTAPSPPAAPGGSNAPTARMYIVQSGDSLSKIAKKFYGDANSWRRIYEANKDVVKNPDLIQPGWKLQIPD